MPSPPEKSAGKYQEDILDSRRRINGLSDNFSESSFMVEGSRISQHLIWGFLVQDITKFFEAWIPLISSSRAWQLYEISERLFVSNMKRVP